MSIDIKVWVRDDEFGEDFQVDIALDDVRAALREAGWSLVRLDDCAKVVVFPEQYAGELHNFDGEHLQVWESGIEPCGTMPDRGTYRLVPVGSGDTGAKGETDE